MEEHKRGEIFSHYEGSDESFVMPDDVTSVADGAFRNNKTLKHIDLRNVRYIGACAFQDCTRLESVVMRKAENIGSMAFAFCRSLRSVTLDSAARIDDWAFLHCAVLDIDGFPQTLRTVGTGSFSHTAVRRAELGWIEAIPDALFLDCTSLEYADVSGARAIGKEAFSGCTSLERAEIDSARDIGDRAFYRCDALVTGKLPSCLETIGDGAFWQVREGITVPLNVRAFGKDCFGPVDRRKSIRLYRPCLYAFRDYFRAGAESAHEEEHFYLWESTTDVTVLDEHTGDVTGFIPLFSDLDPAMRDIVCSAFREDDTFDYSVLDNQLIQELKWNQRGKDRLAIMRLMYPYELSASAKVDYSEYLEKHSGRIAKRAVRDDETGVLVFLRENGFLRKEDITGLIDLSISLTRAECTAYLLECREELCGEDDDDMFGEL